MRRRVCVTLVICVTLLGDSYCGDMMDKMKNKMKDKMKGMFKKEKGCKQKVTAITIPKYKYYDIPLAKEIKTYNLGKVKTMDIGKFKEKDDHGDDDDDDHDDW